MSNTCATHQSRVPRRSSGMIKGGATTVQDERGPGLDLSLCTAVVCEGLPLFILCLLLKSLNVRRFPPPSSRFTNGVTLVPKPGRKEGHAVREPSLLRGIMVLRRSGSRKKRRPPVAARSSGPGAIEEKVGRKARYCAPGLRRGGCRPRGSGGVCTVRLEAEACCHPPCLGRSREQGTRGRLPSTGGAIHQVAASIGPYTKDVQYHRMAPRVRASQLVEDQTAVCQGTGPIFFFLSPLSRLCLSSSFRLLFS